MHKRIKHLIKNMKDVFNIDEINEIAKDTKFVQRKSNITAKDFLTLNVFHGEGGRTIAVNLRYINVYQWLDGLFNLSFLKK